MSKRYRTEGEMNPAIFTMMVGAGIMSVSLGFLIGLQWCNYVNGAIFVFGFLLFLVGLITDMRNYK